MAKNSRRYLCSAAVWFLLGGPAFPQSSPSTEQLLKDLLHRLEVDEARIKELEQKLSAQTGGDMTKAVAAAAPPPAPAPSDSQMADAQAMGGHSMTLPGGPQLKISGFADINLGVGTVANPLIFPLPAPATGKAAFQLGEFDLFLSSQLSSKWSFVSEVVIGADQTNYWGLDIERLQLTYKQNQYFQISAGRYHSAIGYYNTAFHHGTWFQTAEGRPFMYYFEDSGGILPVHNVGVTTTGLVPGTGKLGLHWVAEVGNGRSTDLSGQPVQNFVSDRDRKSANFAAYIQPEAVSGLQIGGSFYFDKYAPIANVGRVGQHISSVYAVLTQSKWEFLNEAVLMNNILPSGRSYNSPLAYTQLSRKFGLYHPYVRYQYINIPNNDPISAYTGRYTGPSVGLRIDVTDYAAFKIQYNRIYQRLLPVANGFNAQLSFAF
jgi:hypothetical protein